MAEGHHASKYDEAMASRDEEQLQPLNPPPAYSAAATPYPATGTPYPAAVTPYPAAGHAPPVTTTGGTHVQYLPVDADGKVTVGTGQRQVQVMVAPNQQVRGKIRDYPLTHFGISSENKLESTHSTVAVYNSWNLIVFTCFMTSFAGDCTRSRSHSRQHWRHRCVMSGHLVLLLADRTGCVCRRR